MYAMFDESSYTIAHKRVITDDDDFLLCASYQKYFLLIQHYYLAILRGYFMYFFLISKSIKSRNDLPHGKVLLGTSKRQILVVVLQLHTPCANTLNHTRQMNISSVIK